MHPAPSVIVFTVLSGMGFGMLAFLGPGPALPSGWPAFLGWGLGYGLAVGGLLASTLHLGRPDRAWRAFSQWRSSWLSREAWAACLALLAFAPVAISDWLGLGWGRHFGLAGAVLAGLTVICTAMIYAQLKTVPRWNDATTPALFMAFAFAGGLMLTLSPVAPAALLGLALLLAFAFRRGDTRFAARAQTMATATGLGGIGAIRVFERGHTAGNYLLSEMIHVVGRRHARKLRVIAVALAGVGPALILLLPFGLAATAAAALCHLAGALAARWLFFAEAEHVVGLYYGFGARPVSRQA